MNHIQHAENPIFALVAEYSFINDSQIDKSIAQITLQNISCIPELNLEKISGLCGVSVSSYLRFCRKIGYCSYTEFKVHITDALQKYTFMNTPFSAREFFNEENFFAQSKSIIYDDFDRLESLLDKSGCRKAVDSMAASDQIFIIDLFYSTVRFALHSDLAVSEKKVTFLRPSKALVSELEKELNAGSFVFIVYDGTSRTKDVCSLLPLCKQIGAHITVMSCIEHFPHRDCCDELLLTGKAESAVSSIMVHDLVFQYLSTLYRSLYITGNT